MMPVIGFEVSGHSSYAEKGYDIICASISMLAINTVNAIKAFTQTQLDVYLDDDGYLKMMVKDILEEDALLLINAFVLGALDVAEKYGNNYVQVRYEEV